MDKLDLTEDQARQLLEDDKAIDKGAKLFELSAEQKKAEKAMRQCDRTPTVYKFTKRERKADTAKSDILQLLIAGVRDQSTADQFQVINPEREFIFQFENRKFKVVLSCHILFAFLDDEKRSK